MKYIFDYLLAVDARYVLQGPVFTLTVSVDRAAPAPASESSPRETRGGVGAQLAAQIATSSAAVLDIVTCAGNVCSQSRKRPLINILGSFPG